MTNPNDPAFGHTAVEMVESALQSCGDPREIHYRGLTKREYFAVVAMQGILSNSYIWENAALLKLTNEVTTSWAIKFADSLIAELNK